MITSTLWMSRDALQQYDEVEFIGIRELGVAVSVSVIQRKPKEVRKRNFVVFSTFFLYLFSQRFILWWWIFFTTDILATISVFILVIPYYLLVSCDINININIYVDNNFDGYQVVSKRVPVNLATKMSSNPFLGYKAIKMAEVRHFYVILPSFLLSFLPFLPTILCFLPNNNFFFLSFCLSLPLSLSLPLPLSPSFSLPLSPYLSLTLFLPSLIWYITGSTWWWTHSWIYTGMERRGGSESCTQGPGEIFQRDLILFWTHVYFICFISFMLYFIALYRFGIVFLFLFLLPLNKVRWNVFPFNSVFVSLPSSLF